MQNFMGLCRNPGLLSRFKRNFPARIGIAMRRLISVRRLDDPSFQFGHQNDSDSRSGTH